VNISYLSNTKRKISSRESSEVQPNLCVLDSLSLTFLLGTISLFFPAFDTVGLVCKKSCSNNTQKFTSRETQAKLE